MAKPSYSMLSRRSIPPRLTEHHITDPLLKQLVENICPSRAIDLFQYLRTLAATFYAESPDDSDEKKVLDKCLSMPDLKIPCMLFKRIYTTLTVRPDEIRSWKDWQDIQHIYLLLTGPQYQAVYACAVSGHFETYFTATTIKGFRFPHLKSTDQETFHSLMKKVEEPNAYLVNNFPFEHYPHLVRLGESTDIESASKMVSESKKTVMAEPTATMGDSKNDNGKHGDNSHGHGDNDMGRFHLLLKFVLLTFEFLLKYVLKYLLKYLPKFQLEFVLK